MQIPVKLHGSELVLQPPQAKAYEKLMGLTGRRKKRRGGQRKKPRR